MLLAQKMLLANMSITNLPNDIGSLLKASSMSTTDIVSIVNSLNQELKYNVKYHLSCLIFSFPKEHSAGCNRCFQDGMCCMVKVSNAYSGI